MLPPVLVAARQAGCAQSRRGVITRLGVLGTVLVAAGFAISAAGCDATFTPLYDDTATAIPDAAAVEAATADKARNDLALVRESVARYGRVEAAEAAGWLLPPGDGCVEHPTLGGMGYHYINFDLVDLDLGVSEPEVLVFVPGPGGRLTLGAAEFIVPASVWDAEHPGELPSVMGVELHRHPVLDLYVLHAWVFRHNPSGILTDFNPNVSCP
jgi:hypothetical protein